MGTRCCLSKKAEKQIKESLGAVLYKALRCLRLPNATAAVFLLSSKEMGLLGGKFRKNGKKVPDVLSFTEPKKFPHPEEKKRFLGEIYLNRDIYCSNPERLEFLTIHGLLHLLGYSHSEKSDIFKMKVLERKLLKAIAGN